MNPVLNVEFAPQDWVSLAAKLKTDPSLRERLHRDPIGYLRSIGVQIDDPFRQVVERQLMVVTHGGSTPDAGQPPEGSFVFTATPWGLVLVINEDGMQWLKNASAERIGAAIGAALSVLAASSTDPLIAALVLIATVWCATQAVWILAEYGMMVAMDEAHHKGVYLTWTWIGLALTCYVPFPTPIT